MKAQINYHKRQRLRKLNLTRTEEKRSTAKTREKRFAIVLPEKEKRSLTITSIPPQGGVQVCRAPRLWDAGSRALQCMGRRALQC
jgi:hypothetical protein